MKSKVVKIFAFVCLSLTVCFIFRLTILRSFAEFLIVESEVEQVEFCFILSGGAFDRGNKGADLFHQGKVMSFVCTGGNRSPDIKALGLDILESDLTKMQLVKMGVPDSAINLIKKGTSTLEEAEIILNFSLEHKLDTVLIVSSKYHTRRVHQVFTNKFLDNGIVVLIQGAPSSMYDELNWWKSEYGLIALNNEYLKQIYYLLKY